MICCQACDDAARVCENYFLDETDGSSHDAIGCAAAIRDACKHAQPVKPTKVTTPDHEPSAPAFEFTDCEHVPPLRERALRMADNVYRESNYADVEALIRELVAAIDAERRRAERAEAAVRANWDWVAADKLLTDVESLREQGERANRALGLLTTLAPHVAVDVENVERMAGEIVSAVRAEVERLKRDKARMDWLETRYPEHISSGEEAKWAVNEEEPSLAYHESDDLRVAIDAAMRKAPDHPYLRIDDVRCGQCGRLKEEHAS